MPWRRHFNALATQYESVDVEARTDGVTYLNDAHDMRQVSSNAYDVVLCSEVLEHLSRPDAAVAELARVLKANGMLLLSVPFLSRLHEEPADFFRFTEHGLRTLLERHGISVCDIVPVGSIFSFLGHQVSSTAMLGVAGIPLIRELVFALNALLVVLPCRMLDRMSGLAHKLPAGYVVVGQRTEGRPGANLSNFGA